MADKVKEAETSKGAKSVPDSPTEVQSLHVKSTKDSGNDKIVTEAAVKKDGETDESKEDGKEDDKEDDKGNAKNKAKGKDDGGDEKEGDSKKQQTVTLSISEITDGMTDKLNQILMDLNRSDKKVGQTYEEIEKRLNALDKVFH